MDKEQLQEIYLKSDYYWGKEPNELVNKVLEFIPDSQITNRKLVDLGAGEGRDSVFFALRGFCQGRFTFPHFGRFTFPHLSI